MKAAIKMGLIVLGLSIFTSAAIAQQNDETGFTMPALNPQSKLAELSGNHVGIRVPDYAAAIKWYTEKLDFRVIHEWDYADEKLAYLAPANSNDFWIEILAGGKLTKPKAVYDDLGKSLEEGGYQHICMHVTNLNNVLAELKSRGVTFVGNTFYLDAIHRNLAFIRDPWGNMIEFAEIVVKK
jgi:lactoylglutathione lyase/glyoxylase I family protein